MSHERNDALLQFSPETSMDDLARNRVESVRPGYDDVLSAQSVARYDDGEGGSLLGIFTYKDVERFAADPATFSSITVPEGAPRILPLMADPPEHTAYKRLFASFFRPDRVRRLEATMRPVAGAMIDGLVGAGTADLAVQFAYAFPTRSLVELLELEDEWQYYDWWSQEMETQTRAGMRKPGEGLPPELFARIVPTLTELTQRRREQPGDDAISQIVVAGLDGEPFSDEEVVGLAIALILAGRATTASGIGNLTLRLARDPQLQDFLRSNPDRIPDAVEECLRIDAPQQEQPRKTTRAVEVGGVTIPAGTPTFLNYGSANVDEAFWKDPDRFDIDRPNKERHLAFGKGVHRCPGAPMGRMQIRVAVEELLARTSAFELAGDVERKTWPRLSVERLPLRFAAATP